MRVIPFLLLVVLSWPVALQARNALAAPVGGLQFHSVGSDRPFQAEIITEVMFDHVGFLWIGTREGLFLHDGRQFRKFQHEVQNPDSISSNGIRGVFEDSHGRLWINTISGGLNLLDRASWRFRSWRHKRNDPDSLVHDGVFALAEAPAGKLWVGTQAGLDLFDPETGKFAHQFLVTGGEFVIALFNDRDGRLWVATLGQGLFRQRSDQSGFDPVQGTNGSAPLEPFSLAQTADGTIWAGARDGLYRIDSGSGRIVPATLAPKAAADKLTLVTALLPTPEGGLWIGTFGNGLFWLPSNSSVVSAVALAPGDPGAQEIDSGAMALDRNGDLFVGTFGAGLLRTSTMINGLQTWQAADDGHPGLTGQDIYALLVEPAPSSGGSASLMAGSFGGGIDDIALADGTIKHAPLPVPNAMQLYLGGITDLLRTRDGEIWATTNQGVFRWNRNNGRFHFYPPDQPPGASTNPDYSFAMLQDRENRIWVGSAGGGLYLYQPERDTFRNFRPVRGDPRSLPDDFVTNLIEDRRDRLWVATRSGGIGVCRFDGKLACQHIEAGPGPRQISHDQVTAMLEARDDAIWVATAGGGLNRLALDAAGDVASVRRWSLDDGLNDDNVMALVYGPDGALWLTTHGGISRLDLQTDKLTNLTPTDGLPTAIFNPKAAVLHGGRLYFGSAKGVVSLDPHTMPNRKAPPPTVIEAVSGLDEAHMPSQPAWQLGALTVPWRTPFSLEFAVLDYSGESPRFQYRLGHSSAWTDLGDRGQLTLHALEPGSHRLEVRGRRDGQGWTLAQPLLLDIVPPWWRRTTTQAIAAILMMAIVLGGFAWRVRELHTRNRTLRRMTMRLEAAKENERKHLARELHDEFGQALTSAKINLGLALAQPPSGDGAARIGDTIGLIDGLIGQVRALSLDLRPPLLDEMGLVPALEAYLHAVSARSGLPIRQQLESGLALTGIDREIAVFRIVQEAVTNALRHSGASALEVSLTARVGGVVICVRDDGKGFDAGAVPAAGGSGLGLFGMRERTHDLGGHWSVDSRSGLGTTVSAFIPREVPALR
ncbi:MAG TPA: two-component regulator propeller domain-containing protein [Rudaea sp.]